MTDTSTEQTGESKSNQHQEGQNIPPTPTATSTATKSQGKKQPTGESTSSPVATTTTTITTTTTTPTTADERLMETPVVETTKETRSRGRPRKGKKNSVDMIYAAVVDAAKTGANVVITDDQACADKTMEALPKDNNTQTAESRRTEKTEVVPEKTEVVPPLRIVVGSKRGLSGRPPGRPKKKRRKMTPRKIVVGGSGNKSVTSGNSNNSAPAGAEESNSVFEAEMPNAENLTEAVSAVVREEKLSVFGEFLEGSGPGGESRPGPGRVDRGRGEEEAETREKEEELPSAATYAVAQFRPQATSSHSSYLEHEHDDDQPEAEMEEQEVEETRDHHHHHPEDGADVEHDTFPEDATEAEDDVIGDEKTSMLTSSSGALRHDESGMELCDSSLETRSPSGCTPDTDATTDSGIGRDAGVLSEQESMDKSHGSGDATPTTPPNMFENHLLSDAHSSGASDTQTTPDPESDARELIMEDMSCQTGDDLLENGNEAEADPGANEHEEEEDEHENETEETNHVTEENDTEATTEEDLEPEDQPMNNAEPTEESETQPHSEMANEVTGVNGSELPDALNEGEEVDAANNNDILDGHDDSEATEEGKKLSISWMKWRQEAI